MDRQFSEAYHKWQEETEKSYPVNKEFTDSGIETKMLYSPRETKDIDYLNKIGFPGYPPHTRGVYNTMYRGRLWTMRQYAGFGTAKETNLRFKYLLEQGVTGLSVAFDLPTQVGHDSDDQFVEDEVGRVGVAIDTLDDLERTFEGIPLSEVSVNFTINSTAMVILAMYVALAQKQGISLCNLRGTTQNDMIKEFLARKSYIFPVAPSLKIVADIIEYCHRYLPRFNPISISGYHIRELGADAIQELALTLLAAIKYSEEVLKRGIDFDDFAPRLSFQFANTLEMFEEIAKYRAARRMWSNIADKRFGAKNMNSGRLRVFAGGTGAALTLDEPLNNIIRGTIQCLVAVLAGAQAVHVPAYDEAYSIPSREAATLSLRTQQVLAYETGITKTIDPLGGSYYLEYLTDELERRAWQLMNKIENRGGIVKSTDDGFIQNEVLNRAYAVEKEKQSGDRVVVGVNKFRADFEERPKTGLQQREDHILEAQKENLRRVKQSRDNKSVKVSLLNLRRALANTKENLFPFVLEAVKHYATIGEIIQIMKDEYGEYREPGVF
jgi:methylmalonyl-CoA mutase N-terminal domain/subunit